MYAVEVVIGNSSAGYNFERVDYRSQISTKNKAYFGGIRGTDSRFIKVKRGN